MRQEIFSIFDSKGKTFGVPFYAAVKELAIRNVTALVRDDSQGASMLAKFPEDFTLYRMGTFDDGTGEFQLQIPPEVVCNLTQLKSK